MYWWGNLRGYDCLHMFICTVMVFMILTNWQKNKAIKLTNLQRDLAVGQVHTGGSKAAVAQSFNMSSSVCTIQNLMVRFSDR